MKFNPQKLEKIGSGGEKNVYVDPKKPDRVIAQFHEDSLETERAIKGRYYLSKILHILLPKNIPDINLSAKNDKKVIVTERKKLDKRHNKLAEAGVRGEGFTNIYFDSAYDEHETKLKLDPRYQKLLDSMRFLDVKVDPSPFNFGYDKDDNLVYVDNTFKPWALELNHKSEPIKVRYLFNKENLLNVINSLDESDKERAMKYFNRLEELREEEEKEVEKSTRKEVTMKIEN